MKNFVHIIGNNADAYLRGGEKGTIEAPMDFAIVSGWKPLVMALLLKEIDGDLLRLVHLSNEFRILNEGSGIYPNDVLNVEAVLDAVTIIDIGKIVEVKEIISAAGTSATRIQIISRFLLRGKFTDYENCFRRKTEDPVELVLKSAKDISVLKSKKWIEWKESFCPESSLQPGCTIIFRLKTMNHFENASVMLKLKTTGSIFLKTTKEVIEIGRIDYQSGDRCHGNVILEYLKRSGKKIEQSIFFEGGGYSVLPDEKIYPASVVSPPNNRNYSLASGDLNPIHTNSYFADLAGLPGTITHGMWTSASTRKFVEIFAANNQPRRVKSYSVTFTDMVLPGDNLSSKLSHIGMTNGRRLIKVETFNQKGAKVLEGLAEVEQQSTAYVFTGQGSQEVGMGMALYKSSLVSKNIWDRADAHMLNEYGGEIWASVILA